MTGNYLDSLLEADLFTTCKQGAISSDLHLGLKACDNRKMRVVLNIIEDFLAPLSLNLVALKCCPICVAIHDKLAKHDLNSIITTGYILLNGEDLFHTNREGLIDQLERNICPKEFHVWLTVGDYIIDPTYMATIYSINHKVYSEQTFCENAIIIHKYDNHPFKLENDTLEYIPQFTGKYFYGHLLGLSK